MPRRIVFPGMGVGGWRWRPVDTAVAQAQQFVADGADILDIGGESTRPGSQPITAEEEMARIMPVIKAIRQAVDCADFC